VAGVDLPDVQSGEARAVGPQPDIDLTSRAPTSGAGTPLTAAQVNHFRTFGFLVLPELFAEEIGLITEGFEEVFAAEEPFAYRHALHFDDERAMIGPGFVDKSAKLSWLRTDHRVQGIVGSLIGEDVTYKDSDGNLFSCDTNWHSDIFGMTHGRLHVKLYFYLDPLRHDSGALRVLPGTNAGGSPFADGVRRALWEADGSETEFDVDPRDLPSWTIPTDPGDLIVGDYRTMHATFGGQPRRRLFTLNYRESGDALVDE
jgi:hypothetical protein